MKIKYAVDGYFSNTCWVLQFFDKNYESFFLKSNPEEIIKDKSLWVLNIKNKDYKDLIEYLLKNSKHEFYSENIV